MAARKFKPHHQDEIRRKIQATQLINFLQNLALRGLVEMGGGRDGGERKLSPDWDEKRINVRVRAALGLLNKSLPDVSSVQLTGDVQHSYIAHVPLTEQNSDEWVKKHAPTLQ